MLATPLENCEYIRSSFVGNTTRFLDVLETIPSRWNQNFRILAKFIQQGV